MARSTRSEEDEAAEARDKLAALKAKRAAARGDGPSTPPHPPREPVVDDPRALALIHQTFGVGDMDGDEPEDMGSDPWVVAADITGEKFRMGYANGTIRCSFVVPAEHFFTLHALAEVSDGFELRFVIHTPPEIAL